MQLSQPWYKIGPLLARLTSAAKEAEAAFNRFDKNGDGEITLQEFEEGMRDMRETMSPEELQAMFEEADTNGDGTISLEEFRHIMTKKKE